MWYRSVVKHIRAPLLVELFADGSTKETHAKIANHSRMLIGAVHHDDVDHADQDEWKNPLNWWRCRDTSKSEVEEDTKANTTSSKYVTVTIDVCASYINNVLIGKYLYLIEQLSEQLTRVPIISNPD